MITQNITEVEKKIHFDNLTYSGCSKQGNEFLQTKLNKNEALNKSKKVQEQSKNLTKELEFKFYFQETTLL